jgi:hypothetical protein
LKWFEPGASSQQKLQNLKEILQKIISKENTFLKLISSTALHLFSVAKLKKKFCRN